MPLHQTKFTITVLVMLAAGMFLTVLSCERHRPPFFIINRTTDTIFSAGIIAVGSPRSDSKVIQPVPFIVPGDTFTYFVNMDGLRSDGGYALTYNVKNDTVHTGFGYFSNGSIQEWRTYIHIYPDTVLCRYEYK